MCLMGDYNSSIDTVRESLHQMLKKKKKDCAELRWDVWVAFLAVLPVLHFATLSSSNYALLGPHFCNA